MPVVIDEIVIAVELTDEPDRGAAAPAAADERQALIQECVERVLDALRQREER